MIYSKPLANFPFPAHPIFDEAVEFLPQILITTLVTFVTTPNDLSCLTITIVSHKRSSFCYSERVFRKKKKKGLSEQRQVSGSDCRHNVNICRISSQKIRL